MTDDVVAELDAWLKVWEGHCDDAHDDLVQRARDELVRLRHLHASQISYAMGRAEALEEAAQACERILGMGGYTLATAAAAIRALKDDKT